MDSTSQADSSDEVAQDLVDMLLRCPAFVGVDRRTLARLIRRATLVYAADGDAVEGVEDPLVVQRGGLLVHDVDGRTLDVVAAEEYRRPAPGERLEALEGTLILVLPEAAADVAWSAPAPARREVTSGAARRIDLQTTPAGDLMARDLVTARADESCRVVAQRMSARRVSSVLVLGRPEPGIATDRDLRTRLVAVGGSPDDPIAAVATFGVRTISAGTPAFDALIEMLSWGIHHLPVTDGGQLVGMITSSDLMQLQMRNPLHLRKALDHATSVEACADALALLPDSVHALRSAGTTPGQIGEVMTTVADRCVTKLVALALDDLGPAPAPYGWLAFGSQARREISLGSDQDTGLVVPDGLGHAAHTWFANLGAWVTAGLEQCGYPRCAGGVMASEAEWRAEVSGWRRRFDRWMTTPVERHLLDVEIVFDVRTVAGEIDAVDVIGPSIRSAQHADIFLARLASQAIRHRPPLGFFGRLTVERSGTHAGTFDLKAGALMPIVDIARLHTLARGGLEVATTDRLEAAVGDGVLSRDLASTLTAGHELALGIRLDRALERMDAGLPPSNRVDPSTLPALVRAQLKETFKALQSAQDHIRSSYQLIDR